jgi:nucleoside recognition membrane protein YjiH
LWKFFYPAVPRRWLFAIAGFIWAAVGVLLCGRAIVWLEPFPLITGLVLESAGLILASAGYVYGFSTVARKNIARIQSLPDRACAFAFTAWRGYVMIGLMITIGITLRNSAIPKYYLTIPYSAMGGVLLIGSAQLFSAFLVSPDRGT